MALALGPAGGQRQKGLEEAGRTVIKLILNNGEKATLVM